MPRLRSLAAVALAVAPLLLAAKPAAALEYHLVIWKKTRKCQVITHLPIFGNHWRELAVFDTKSEADWALRERQRMRICPPDDKPKPVAVKPKRRPKPPEEDNQNEFWENPAGVW